MTVTLPSTSLTVTTTADFTTSLSQIRSKIGDTGGYAGNGRVYLTDERIGQATTEDSTVLGASIICVRMILADIAKDADFSAGAISTSGRSQVYQNYESLLALLMAEQATNVILPAPGGSLYSQYDTVNARADVIPRKFGIGMDENV